MDMDESGIYTYCRAVQIPYQQEKATELYPPPPLGENLNLVRQSLEESDQLLGHLLQQLLRAAPSIFLWNKTFSQWRIRQGGGGVCKSPVLRIQIRIRIRIHRIHMFLGLLDPDPLVRGMDPDPLVRGMDPRIQIRIHTKTSWIRNTGSPNVFCYDFLNIMIWPTRYGITSKYKSLTPGNIGYK